MTRAQTATLKKAFLQAFRDCGSITAAATIAGLRTRKEHYRWLEIDPQYAEDFSEAEEGAIEIRGQTGTKATLKKRKKSDERRFSDRQ